MCNCLWQHDRLYQHNISLEIGGFVLQHIALGFFSNKSIGIFQVFSDVPGTDFNQGHLSQSLTLAIFFFFFIVPRLALAFTFLTVSLTVIGSGFSQHTSFEFASAVSTTLPKFCGPLVSVVSISPINLRFYFSTICHEDVMQFNDYCSTVIGT